MKRPQDSPRSILMAGEYGTGKCITEDSRIHTSYGYLKIQNLPFGRDKGEGFFELSGKVMNDQNILAFYDGGFKNTVKIKSSQFDLEGTPNHRVKVLTDRGVDWKYMEDLKVGDWVALPNREPLLFNNETPKPSIYAHLNEQDYGYLVGLLYGDGNVTSNKIIYCGNNETLEEIKSIVIS